MTLARLALAIALASAISDVGLADTGGDALSARSAIPAETTVLGDAATPAPDATPAPGLNPLWAIPLKSLTATRERPLFAPTRRPPAPVIPAAQAQAPPPPPVAAKPAAPERPPLTLVGTILNADGNIAIVQDQTTQKVLSVRQGEAAAGWRVTDVTARAATVEKNAEVVTLALPTPGADGGAGATLPGMNIPGAPVPGGLEGGAAALGISMDPNAPTPNMPAPTPAPMSNPVANPAPPSVPAAPAKDK